MKHLLIAVGLFVVACSSANDEGVAGPHTKYADMTFEERVLFMNDVVLPQMKETFVAFDPKYATMSCDTCHGSGVTKGDYKMPSSDIAALPPTEEAFFEYIKDPEHARWANFMMERVWPQMAKALDVPMFDPATQVEGFSCSNCHTSLASAH